MAMTMTMRVAAKYLPRRYSSGGKVLGKEGKALENVPFKAPEQAKLEKLASKEQKLTGSPAMSTVGSVSQSSGSMGSQRVSTDKAKNYAVVAGAITAMAALGWYLKANPNKEQIQD